MQTSPDSSETGTVPDSIKHWADIHPDKEVFVFHNDAGRRALTCKDVYILSMKFAALLQRRGLKHGDVVCNTLTNSPERLVTDLGIIAAGCIGASAQALLPDGTDMLHLINLSKCRLLVADNTMTGDAWDLLKGHLGEVLDLKIQSEKTPMLEMVHFVGVAKDDQFLAKLLKEDEPTPIPISPMDVAVYWNTSGSTGFSKLVAHKHHAMRTISSEMARMYRVKETDTLYSDRPFGWGGGWPFLFVHLGIKQVLIDTRGSVADQCKLTWDVINREKCTIAYLTITFLKQLLARDDVLLQKDTPPLTMVVATGQPFRKHYIDVVGKICRSVVSSYALIETGCVTSYFCEEEEHFEDNVVGHVSERLQLKIVDENFQEVAQGESGQILIKGPHILQGYVNNAKATKESFTDDGWFKTGDVGMFDGKGCLFIEGREADGIKSGEHVVHPSAVERKLRTCPFVDEVMVVGIPDPDRHNRICACVIPKSGMNVTREKIQEFCDPLYSTDTSLRTITKPEFYILVESFPVRPTGKPDRRALAEMATKLVTADVSQRSVKAVSTPQH